MFTKVREMRAAQVLNEERNRLARQIAIIDRTVAWMKSKQKPKFKSQFPVAFYK